MHGPSFMPPNPAIPRLMWFFAIVYTVEGIGQAKSGNVGFVRAADRSHIYTVEGNTSSGAAGSQWDGDGVFCRTRPREQVFGFVAW